MLQTTATEVDLKAEHEHLDAENLIISNQTSQRYDVGANRVTM